VSADQGHVRVALAEIERLMSQAQESGLELDRLVRQLAVELRIALPENEKDTRIVADLILSDPRRSIGAQAHLTANNLHALND
jgi:hypothetical protein